MTTPAPTDPSKITLAILAGGLGSRMGQPKSRLQIHHQPILQFLLDRFHWPGPTLLVTAPGNQHPPAHEKFSAEATDPTPNLGPLRGALTALENSTTPIVLLTPVDMPLISTAQLIHLATLLEARPQTQGLLLTRILNWDSIIEPLPLVLRKTAAPILQDHLNNNRKSLHSLAENPAFLTLPAPANWPQESWFNLNDQEDLSEFLKYDAAQNITP